jgi:hypothetical protein
MGENPAWLDVEEGVRRLRNLMRDLERLSRSIDDYWSVAGTPDVDEAYAKTEDIGLPPQNSPEWIVVNARTVAVRLEVLADSMEPDHGPETKRR